MRGSSAWVRLRLSIPTGTGELEDQLAIVEPPELHPVNELPGGADPDDFRPGSQLAFVFDPTAKDGSHVRSLSFIFEECGPGERVPLHRHSTDEAIVLDEGVAEVVLGAERRLVQAGTVVFVPAGTPHYWGNPGSGVLRGHGVFPTDVLDIEYLGRNPAPGTEGEAPQPAFSIDLRAG